MRAGQTAGKHIDEYIAGCPNDVQTIVKFSVKKNVERAEAKRKKR
jgi:hypothetical protein